MTTPQSSSSRRRRRSALAVLAALPLAAGVGAAGTASAATPSAGPLSTITAGLNNPRHLHFMNGKLYVAEAGTGGSFCPPSAKDPETGEASCVGRTGDIAVVGVAGSTTRIMKGLSSVAPKTKAAAGGPADVAFYGGNPVALVQDGNLDSKGGNPFGPLGNQLGKLVVGLQGGAGPNVPGPDFGVYEAQHNPDHGAAADPGQEIDSDPYGVTPYRGGFAVADAAGNDVLFVNSQGVISTLAVLPPNNAPLPACFGGPPGARGDFQAVPTSVRVGPDGALYVPELSGAPGAAKVYRVVPGHAPTVYAAGFDSITDLAFDSKGRMLVTSLTGGLFCGNGSGKLIRYNKQTNTKTTLTDAVSFPTGLAVNGNRVYMSSNGASPAGGAAGGKIVTLVQLN